MPEEVKKTYQFERRRYQRIRKNFKVRFRKFVFPFTENDPGWHQGVITNISACGIFILLQKDFLLEPLQIGDMLHMEIELGRWNEHKANDKPFDYYYQREPFTVLGQIIRFDDNEEKRMRVGIDFIGVDESQRQSVFRHIQRLMNNNHSEGSE